MNNKFVNRMFRFLGRTIPGLVWCRTNTNAIREEDFVEFILFGIGQRISLPKENNK